jgi:hypothetical protein
MTIRRTTALVVLLACAAASLLSVASAASKATKQQVSILADFNTQTGGATWELIPLSPGPLKRDKGSSQGGGEVKAQTLLNGQRVTPIIGSDSLTGKRGTLVISQKIVITQVGQRFHSGIGTWRVVRGTGAYKGITGGGRYADVGLPGGTVLVNQEGYLTIG